MTAYRTAPAPAEGPYVNEYLERALLEYYARYRRRDVKIGAVGAIAMVLAALYVVAAKPDDGWLSTPTAVLGLPGAFGFLFGLGSYLTRRPVLLDHVRTGIPIQRVRRADRPLDVRTSLLVRAVSGESRIHVNDVHTLYVDFCDGRASALPSLGDDKQLARIEELLRIQMTKANPRLRA